MNRSLCKILCSLFLVSCNDTAVDKKLPTLENYVGTLQFYGDSREGPNVYAALLDIGYAHFPSGPVIHLGDIISSPSHSEQYSPFLGLTTRYHKRDKLFVTIGNHDVDNQNTLENAKIVFPEIGEFGYSAKKIGNCFCIFLNSEDLTRGSNLLGTAQRQWLESTLLSAESKSAKYRIVMIHRPIFPQNQHAGETFDDNDALHQLFVDHKVQAVVSGHEHSYSHIVDSGVHYLITGGAGSPLFKGAGDAAFYHFMQMFETTSELKFYAIDILGRTRDEFTIPLSTL